MNKLRGMQLFSQLPTTLAAVAEEIGSTPSMVSKEIQKLEQEVGLGWFIVQPAVCN